MQMGVLFLALCFLYAVALKYLQIYIKTDSYSDCM